MRWLSVLTVVVFAASVVAMQRPAAANDLNFSVFAGQPRPAEQIEPLAFQVFVAPQPVALEQIPPAAFAVFSYPAPAPRPEPKPQPIKPPPAASPVAGGVPHCGYYFDPFDGRLKWRCFY